MFNLKMKLESDHLALWSEKLSAVLAMRQLTITEDVDVEAAINRAATRFKNVKGQVVVVPLYGFISHKPTVYSALGWETSSETFVGWLEELVSNSDVGAIVIDVDSPGGTVAGLSSASERIYNMRGTKPIVAVSSDLNASAAYFLSSSADEVVADPDSLTGSIGTIAIHASYEKLLEANGVDVTIIKAGKYKDEGNPYQALTEEAKENYQSMVDGYYETFVAAVARNRNMTPAKVKSQFGQGRVLSALEAKNVGMVDRVATVRDVVAGVRRRAKRNFKNKLTLMKLKA